MSDLILKAHTDRAVSFAKAWLEMTQGDYKKGLQRALKLWDAFQPQNSSLSSALKGSSNYSKVTKPISWQISPIDRLLHEWARETGAIKDDEFFDLLAGFVLLSGKIGDESWWGSIIANGAWLADIQIRVLKKVASEAEPLKDQKRRQIRGLIAENEAKAARSAMRKQVIYAAAENLLKKGQNPRDIISLLAKNFPEFKKDQIRHLLRSHPSNHWKPKPKPKTQKKK